jgi:WD40 repeat protein
MRQGAECVKWRSRVTGVPIGVTPFGAKVAVGTSEGEAVLFDAESGVERIRSECDGGILNLTSSPNGEFLTVTGPFGAWLWGNTDASHTCIIDGEWCSVARWVTNDRWVLAHGKHVAVYTAQGGKRWLSETLPSTVSDVVWAGGRHRLAIAVYGGVHVAEPRENGPMTHLPFKGSLLALASSPNGKWLVSGNQDSSLQVFRTDKDSRLEMQGYPTKITQVAFDSSGRWLANNGAPEISVWDFGGSGPRGKSPVLCVSPQDSDQPTAFAWHGNEARLAIGWASGTVTCITAVLGVSGQPTVGATIAAPSSEVTAMEWCGENLVVCRQDGTIDLLGPVSKAMA